MVTIKKLNCGTTVIMEKSERVQSAALGIWVRAGASDEWDEVSGVSHFIEHMMFKGTKNRTAKQIAEDVDKIGGVFNAFTGKEATCYYIKTLSLSQTWFPLIPRSFFAFASVFSEKLDTKRISRSIVFPFT